MDDLRQSLQARLRSGAFGPEDLMDFFTYLVAFGNGDEEMQEEVEGWQGTIQMHLPGMGDVWLRVQDGTFVLGQGTAPQPAVTLTMSAQDAVRLFTGQLDPAEALGTGALRIEGDMTAALRLQGLLEITMDSLV